MDHWKGARHAGWPARAILLRRGRADFEQLLASLEGQAAVADVPNYATGGATFLYTEVKDVV